MPAASWVLTPQGAGLAYPQFHALWRIIKDPESTTIHDVHQLFFYQRGSRMPHEGDSLDGRWDMHMEEAGQQAHEERARMAASVARAAELRASLQGMFLDIDALEPRGAAAASGVAGTSGASADAASSLHALQQHDILSQPWEGDFEVSRLDEPVILRSRSYPRAVVWAYHALSTGARRKVLTRLPAEVMLALPLDMADMFRVMFQVGCILQSCHECLPTLRH